MRFFNIMNDEHCHPSCYTLLAAHTDASLGSYGVAEPGVSTSLTDDMGAAKRATSVPMSGNGRIVFNSLTSGETLPTGLIDGGTVDVTQEDPQFANALLSKGMANHMSNYYAPPANTLGENKRLYNDTLLRILSNSTHVYYLNAENVYFCNHRMYCADYSINSADYDIENTKTGDTAALIQARYAKLLSGDRAIANPVARGLANRVHALKTAILAQTNDTNPFYNMTEAEIYDRLQDYFALIGRALASLYNTRAALGIRAATNVGAQSYYKNVYSALYTADAVVRIQEKLATLSGNLAGKLFDSAIADGYLSKCVITMAPSQKGAFRLLIPCNRLGYESTDKHFALGEQLLPSSVYNQPEVYLANILGMLDEFSLALCSEEVAIANAALAPFSICEQLPIIPVTALFPKVNSSLVYELAATATLQFGDYAATNTRYRTLVAGSSVTGKFAAGKDLTANYHALQAATFDIAKQPTPNTKATVRAAVLYPRGVLTGKCMTWSPVTTYPDWEGIGPAFSADDTAYIQKVSAMLAEGETLKKASSEPTILVDSSSNTAAVRSFSSMVTDYGMGFGPGDSDARIAYNPAVAYKHTGLAPAAIYGASLKGMSKFGNNKEQFYDQFKPFSDAPLAPVEKQCAVNIYHSKCSAVDPNAPDLGADGTIPGIWNYQQNLDDSVTVIGEFDILIGGRVGEDGFEKPYYFDMKNVSYSASCRVSFLVFTDLCQKFFGFIPATSGNPGGYKRDPSLTFAVAPVDPASYNPIVFADCMTSYTGDDQEWLMEARAIRIDPNNFIQIFDVANKYDVMRYSKFNIADAQYQYAMS